MMECELPFIMISAEEILTGRNVGGCFTIGQIIIPDFFFYQ